MAAFELKGWELPSPEATELWYVTLDCFPPEVIRRAFCDYVANGANEVIRRAFCDYVANGANEEYQPERLEPAVIRRRCYQILDADAKRIREQRDREEQDRLRRDHKEHPENYVSTEEFQAFMADALARWRAKKAMPQVTAEEKSA